FVLGHYSIAKSLPGISLTPILLKPFVAALAMALVIILTREMNLFFVMVFGISGYLAPLFALRTFTGDEISLLKGALTPAAYAKSQ
ncbi:MAG: hypothetical protein JRJ65_19755, partial [Deltaproteobacteria bacterium]|nr:hypothetical protein [Deltaproteobacteria bacterium]